MDNQLPRPEFKLNGKTIARLLDADHIELCLPDGETTVVTVKEWADIIACAMFGKGGDP